MILMWISWGYAHDLRMMRQLAMALKVCRNTRFWQSSNAVRLQAVRPAREAVRPATSGGPTGQASGVMAGGQTGHGRRSDRHLIGFPERSRFFLSKFWKSPLLAVRPALVAV